MFRFRNAVLSSTLCLFPSLLAADPEAISCKMMAVLSQNRVAELEPTLNEFAARWVPESRDGAIQQLSALLSSQPFVGGSVHRTTKLGEDLEEHVILLRLKDGEVAAMRMRYEWTPDGLTLAGVDFKRQVEELSTLPFPSVPEEIDCPKG